MIDLSCFDRKQNYFCNFLWLSESRFLFWQSINALPALGQCHFWTHCDKHDIVSWSSIGYFKWRMLQNANFEGLYFCFMIMTWQIVFFTCSLIFIVELQRTLTKVLNFLIYFYNHINSQLELCEITIKYYGKVKIFWVMDI